MNGRLADGLTVNALVLILFIGLQGVQAAEWNYREQSRIKWQAYDAAVYAADH